jgi:hypothetical protein
MEVVKETDADRREERKVFPGKKGTQRQAHTKPFACKKDAGLQLIHDVPIVQYLVVPLKKRTGKGEVELQVPAFSSSKRMDSSVEKASENRLGVGATRKSSNCSSPGKFCRKARN